MSLELWRNISIIWLSLLCLIALAIPLALFFVLVRLMNRAHFKVLEVARKSQQVSRSVADRSVQYSERATAPILRLRTRASSLRTTVRTLAGAPPASALNSTDRTDSKGKQP